MSLASMQESYLQGLRQITGANQKKAVAAPSDRPGLGSRPKQTGPEIAQFDRAEQLKQAFDISNKALLASLFFWIVLMYILYIFGSYGLTTIRVVWDDTDLSGECQVKFSTDATENLKIVDNYPRAEAGPYISRFPSDHLDFEDYPTESTKLPPIVTAATSSQFFQLQGFIRHLHEDLKPFHSDIKLIVYDLGFYKREKEILQQYCDCEVKAVDYSIFPDHVSDTTNFAWRPLVLQTVMEEYGAVIFAEVTTRFKNSNALTTLKSRGPRDFLLWDVPIFTSIVAYTNKLTFMHLNETRCLYNEANILDTQLLVLYKTNKTWQYVMKPWLKCALTSTCIAPSWSKSHRCLHFRRPKTTGCHSYDISALTIIVNRGMQMTVGGYVNKHMPPRMTHFSDDEPTLFIEQPWSTSQLMILLCIPAIFLLFCVRRQMFRCLNGTILRKY